MPGPVCMSTVLASGHGKLSTTRRRRYLGRWKSGVMSALGAADELWRLLSPFPGAWQAGGTIELAHPVAEIGPIGNLSEPDAQRRRLQSFCSALTGVIGTAAGESARTGKMAPPAIVPRIRDRIDAGL